MTRPTSSSGQCKLINRPFARELSPPTDTALSRSIEGSTIIIASSIPVMQPLAEVLFGRRLFGSSGSKGRRYYDAERGGKGSDGSHASSQPGHLVTIGQKSSRPRPKKAFHDDLEMTVGGGGGGGSGFTSSEEDILHPRHHGSNDRPTAVAVDDGDAPRLSDAIVKTNVVTVTYGENTDRSTPTTASERWKPV